MTLRAKVRTIFGNQPRKKEPPPWQPIDDDPNVRVLYVFASMPVHLLDTIAALEHDPRTPEVEAEAERQQPLLAAAVRELNAAVEAAGDSAPPQLPHPADAIVRAREWLHGTKRNQVEVPYGRVNRRWLPGGVRYDTSTLAGAVEALLDHWAYLTWNLDRKGHQLWCEESHAGLDWWADRAERNAQNHHRGTP